MTNLRQITLPGHCPCASQGAIGWQLIPRHVLLLFPGEHGEHSDSERRDILSKTEIMLTLSNKFEVQEDEKKDQKNMLIR